MIATTPAALLRSEPDRVLLRVVSGSQA